ncbi:MAG: hypothetical protein EOO03_00705 [Chitinophagaceae bacterium]|nr:MAG: hypothetical protein EOO03_00705 [Chitinophagaceae bacterium]
MKIFFTSMIICAGLVASAQNVGIGTTAPGTKFTVRPVELGYVMENSAENSPVVIKTFLNTTFGQIGTSSNHPFELMAHDGIGQFRLMPNGYTGIGIENPTAKLHVGYGNVLFAPPGAMPSVNLAANPPTSGGGHRMMWYADKAAFRVGSVSSTQWDKDSIGVNSVAMGNSTKAIGRETFAVGNGAVARGAASVAIGPGPRAEGSHSTAMGYLSEAAASFSLSIGMYTKATGYGSNALGAYTKAASNWETVVGYNSKEYTPFATGDNFTNQKDRVFTIGNGFNFEPSNALVVLKSGNTGIGEDNPLLAGLIVNTKVSAVNALFGSNTSGVAIESQSPGIAYNCYYNDSRKAISPGYAALTGQDPNGGRFYIMTSSTSATIADATADLQERISIIPNGNVIIGGGTPDQRLSVNGNASKTGGGAWATFSDARVKKNISPYTAGLAEILAIRPVSFQYNELSGYADVNTQFVGVIAQEIENILPNTISKTDVNPAVKDLRSFNSSELTYTLINAVKEQQLQMEQERKEQHAIIAALKLQLEQLQKQIDALKK